MDLFPKAEVIMKDFEEKYESDAVLASNCGTGICFRRNDQIPTWMEACSEKLGPG